MSSLMGGEGHSTIGAGTTPGIYFLLDGVQMLVTSCNPPELKVTIYLSSYFYLLVYLLVTSTVECIIVTLYSSFTIIQLL